MQRAAALLSLGGVLIAFTLAGPAAANEETENKLREALRSSITQSRMMEDERAQLQAKLADAEKMIQSLRQQVEEKGGKGGKGGPIDKDVMERLEAEFNRRLTAQHEQAQQMNETLEKWKAAYQEAANTAKAKEAARLQAAGQLEAFSQRATACEAKNAELFKVGNEILQKYSESGIVDALSSHEPFLGLGRVELQNLVQDYQDKLLDQKAVP